MYLKLRYIYFHPMGMLYCCHVTGTLTPKPVLIRNNGIMWFCGSVVQGSKCTSEHVVLWFRGQSSKHDEIGVNGAMEP